MAIHLDFLITFIHQKHLEKLDLEAEQAFLEVIRFRNACPYPPPLEHRRHIDELYRIFDTKKLAALEYAEKHRLESAFFEPGFIPKAFHLHF